jgi:hypothetical protein
MARLLWAALFSLLSVVEEQLDPMEALRLVAA